MERCALKNTLITKAVDTMHKGLGATRTASWHVRRELFKRAFWLAALYGVAQLIGAREWTLALLQGAAASPTERVGCLVYLFLYGSFIFIVPTLALAALLLTIWETVAARRARQ